MHQPNSFVNTYLGYIMWDYESDAELPWPKEQRYPTEAEKRASLDHNPEGAAPRGLWTNIEFEKVLSLNLQAHTQFADYHGHGWNFMAVYKRDRKGNLLDANDDIVLSDDPDKFKRPHLKDIHLEKGMHCADCHFSQDEHGNGQIYGEYGNNIEIECQDCHGTATAYEPARPDPPHPRGGTDLRLGSTPFGQRRFAWLPTGKLMQRSMVNPGMEWEVKQVKDTITAGHANYNERSHAAKAIQPHTAKLYLLRVSHVVDDVVLRLPPPAGTERRQPGAALRGHGHAQLRVVQPAGDPHRRVHARRELENQRFEARARALVERARHQLHQSAEAADLHSATADRRIGVQQSGVQSARTAHRAQPRDARVEAATSPPGTTTTPGWRSSSCRERTSSTSSASHVRRDGRGRIEALPSPSGTSRRP